MTELTPFAGFVLTGGRSRRYGSDKALIDIGGVPLAGHLLGLLADAGADPVSTVGGPDRNIGFPHIFDRFAGAGPLGGLISALDECAKAWALVVATDLVALDVATLTGMAGARTESCDAVVALSERREPMCAIWRVRPALKVMLRSWADGQRSVLPLFDMLDTVEHVVDPAPMRNVNRPCDHLSSNE